jgi:hypothetical protein
MADLFIERFICKENIQIFKKRLETASDQAQRNTLLMLLAEEEAKAGRLVVGTEGRSEMSEIAPPLAEPKPQIKFQASAAKLVDRNDFQFKKFENGFTCFKQPARLAPDQSAADRAKSSTRLLRAILGWDGGDLPDDYCD